MTKVLPSFRAMVTFSPLLLTIRAVIVLPPLLVKVRKASFTLSAGCSFLSEFPSKKSKTSAINPGLLWMVGP